MISAYEMWGQSQEQGQKKKLTKGKDEQMQDRRSKEGSGKLGWEKVTLVNALQVCTPRCREPRHNICNEKAQEHTVGGSEINTPAQPPTYGPSVCHVCVPSA